MDLSTFSSAVFDRGAGKLKEALWLVTSRLLFRLCPFSFSAVKCTILRSFGAKVGRGVVIKPDVKITFPWKLTVGDHVWLGEEAWLLNLAPIEIESSVCISQRAFLCTGSHRYDRDDFALETKSITVRDGSWIAAQAFIGPGVEIGEGAVVSAGSVVLKDVPSKALVRGNPAEVEKTIEGRGEKL